MSTWCSPTLEPFTTFVGVPQPPIWSYPQQYASHPPQKIDQGPLVGPRQSSSALTTEYAAADDVYVQKTTSLPNKYSYYRTVRGDGNCGWRAGAFCYFETLLNLADQKKTLQELDRLQAANTILTGAGFVDEVFLDFAQASFDLLKKIAAAPTSGPERDAIVHNFFNEVGEDADPNAVIAHFKFLTSAWMKTNPAKYADFVESGDVAEYCKNFIEPFGTEIDHIGVMALTAAFLIPAGLALEVLYLDRSPGSEVNTHRFEAYDDNGQPVNPSSPTISLLYRPGHYDILYKLDHTNPIAAPTGNVAASLAFRTYTPLQPPLQQQPPLSRGQSFAWDHSNHLPPQLLPGLPLPSPSVYPSQSGSTPTTPNDTYSDSYPSPNFVNTPSQRRREFRQSKYQYDLRSKHETFVTQAFRNSHYNPAHYLNTEFQPEVWTPADMSRST